MLTLKGNTAVHKLKICGSALFSGLTDQSGAFLPGIAPCYLTQRYKAGHCGHGLATSQCHYLHKTLQSCVLNDM
jgi:hypothetical protein